MVVHMAVPHDLIMKGFGLNMDFLTNPAPKIGGNSALVNLIQQTTSSWMEHELARLKRPLSQLNI